MKIYMVWKYIWSALLHRATIKQQYLLRMSSQYGELQPTNGLDRFVSLGHPIKFQQVSCLGVITTATSLTRGQPNFARCLAVSLAGTPYFCLFYKFEISLINYFSSTVIARWRFIFGNHSHLYRVVATRNSYLPDSFSGLSVVCFPLYIFQQCFVFMYTFFNGNVDDFFFCLFIAFIPNSE